MTRTLTSTDTDRVTESDTKTLETWDLYGILSHHKTSSQLVESMPGPWLEAEMVLG